MVASLRLYLYAGVLLAVFFGGWALHRHIYNQGYNAAKTADKLASDAALKDAEYRIAAIQKQETEATQKVVNDYESKLQDAAVTASNLTAAVLRYKATLRQQPLPTGTSPAAIPDVAPTGSAGDAAINDAITGAISACQDDSAELAALQAWVSTTLH